MEEKLTIEGVQSFDEYILIAPESDYGKVMWNDISRLENGKVMDGAIYTSNRLLKFLHHAHFSFAINGIVKLPFQGIWRKMYGLNQIDLNEKAKCVIFTDVSVCRTDCGYLEWISKLPNITLVLIMVNTMKHKKSILEERLKYFKIIFSFDQKDVDQYGFYYHPMNYSVCKPIEVKKEYSDAFFVGVSKGRLPILKKIYVMIKEKGGIPSFFIAGVKKKEREGEHKIHYNEWLSYKEVLEYVMNTNCVVEVMEDGQQGITLRAMEAVVFNKKLLTNNKTIKEWSFYNSEYIQVFDDVDKIDINFILEKKSVNYEYNNEFSPIHLIEHIEEILCNM